MKPIQTKPISHTHTHTSTPKHVHAHIYTLDLVWFLYLRHINLCGLFNAKALFVEEQQ